MIGSMNCRIATRAKCGKVRFIYDGTITGLVNAAIAHGLKPGDIIEDDCGHKPGKCGCRDRHILISAPHDDRCGGFWADRIW